MTHLKRLRESELERNLVKKYKPTSRILTSFICKINDKIKCHNNDNSYDEDKLIIDHVNDDCLAEIFMYVPACERPKIALVCKKWKRVLDDYSWFDVKKLELTHWELDKYPNFLIKNYPTIDGQFSFLKSLLNKCGRYLIELDLTAYGHCNIVPVINEYCPNLVKLRIRIKYIEDEILDNAFTGLSKLKVLKIIFRCFQRMNTCLPVTLVNSLLNVADTLTELNLSNWSGCMVDNSNFPEEFTSVISELKALERIQVSGINHSQPLINYLISKRPKLIASNDDCKYEENKINEANVYKYLKKLDIRKSFVTDDFLYNVANIWRQLHTVHINCNWVTDADIVAVSKINHLRILDCFGFCNVTDSSIELLKNIFSLTLPFSNKITNKSAIKVLENSPDIHYFCVKNTGVTSEFIKKADEISRNRKKKLKVVISYEDGIPDTQMYEYLTVEYVKKDEP